LLQYTASDVRMLARGLVVLFLIIVVGVDTAEGQLNDLTLRETCVQALNMKRDDQAGFYDVFVLGTDFRFKAMYRLAGLSNEDGKLIVNMADQQFTIPTMMHFELEQTRAWVNLAREQCVQQALQDKKVLADRLGSLRKFIRSFMTEHRRLG